MGLDLFHVCVPLQSDLQVSGHILQHVVGGLYGLGIHFVGTLGFDHVDQFFDDIDVGRLQGTLGDRTQAVETGGSG